MRILVGTKTGNKENPYKYVVGGFKSYSDQYIIESPDIIEEGSYYAFIQLDWNNSLINTFSLWALGYGIKVEEVEHSEWPNFLSEWIKDYARSTVTEYRTSKDDPDIIMKHYLGERTAGYGFHFYENNSKNRSTLAEKLTYTKQVGIKLLFKTNSQQSTFVEVRSMSDHILLFKRTEGSWSTNYSYLSYLKHTAKFLAQLCLNNGEWTEILNADKKPTGMTFHILCK